RRRSGRGRQRERPGTAKGESSRQLPVQRRPGAGPKSDNRVAACAGRPPCAAKETPASEGAGPRIKIPEGVDPANGTSLPSRAEGITIQMTRKSASRTQQPLPVPGTERRVGHNHARPRSFARLPSPLRDTTAPQTLPLEGGMAKKRNHGLRP